MPVEPRSPQYLNPTVAEFLSNAGGRFVQGKTGTVGGSRKKIGEYIANFPTQEPTAKAVAQAPVALMATIPWTAATLVSLVPTVVYGIGGAVIVGGVNFSTWAIKGLTQSEQDVFKAKFNQHILTLTDVDKTNKGIGFGLNIHPTQDHFLAQLLLFRAGAIQIIESSTGTKKSNAEVALKVIDAHLEIMAFLVKAGTSKPTEIEIKSFEAARIAVGDSSFKQSVDAIFRYNSGLPEQIKTNLPALDLSEPSAVRSLRSFIDASKPIDNAKAELLKAIEQFANDVPPLPAALHPMATVVNFNGKLQAFAQLVYTNYPNNGEANAIIEGALAEALNENVLSAQHLKIFGENFSVGQGRAAMLNAYQSIRSGVAAGGIGVPALVAAYPVDIAGETKAQEIAANPLKKRLQAQNIKILATKISVAARQKLLEAPNLENIRKAVKQAFKNGINPQIIIGDLFKEFLPNKISALNLEASAKAFANLVAILGSYANEEIIAEELAQRFSSLDKKTAESLIEKLAGQNLRNFVNQIDPDNKNGELLKKAIDLIELALNNRISDLKKIQSNIEFGEALPKIKSQAKATQKLEEYSSLEVLSVREAEALLNTLRFEAGGLNIAAIDAQLAAAPDPRKQELEKFKSEQIKAERELLEAKLNKAVKDKLSSVMRVALAARDARANFIANGVAAPDVAQIKDKVYENLLGVDVDGFAGVFPPPLPVDRVRLDNDAILNRALDVAAPAVGAAQDVVANYAAAQKIIEVRNQLLADGVIDANTINERVIAEATKAAIEATRKAGANYVEVITAGAQAAIFAGENDIGVVQNVVRKAFDIPADAQIDDVVNAIVPALPIGYAPPANLGAAVVNYLNAPDKSLDLIANELRLQLDNTNEIRDGVAKNLLNFERIGGLGAPTTGAKPALDDGIAQDMILIKSHLNAQIKQTAKTLEAQYQAEKEIGKGAEEGFDFKLNELQNQLRETTDETLKAALDAAFLQMLDNLDTPNNPAVRFRSTQSWIDYKASPTEENLKDFAANLRDDAQKLIDHEPNNDDRKPITVTGAAGGVAPSAKPSELAMVLSIVESSNVIEKGENDIDPAYYDEAFKQTITASPELFDAIRNAKNPTDKEVPQTAFDSLVAVRAGILKKNNRLADQAIAVSNDARNRADQDVVIVANNQAAACVAAAGNAAVAAREAADAAIVVTDNTEDAAARVREAAGRLRRFQYAAKIVHAWSLDAITALRRRWSNDANAKAEEAEREVPLIADARNRLLDGNIASFSTVIDRTKNVAIATRKTADAAKVATTAPSNMIEVARIASEEVVGVPLVNLEAGAQTILNQIQLIITAAEIIGVLDAGINGFKEAAQEFEDQFNAFVGGGNADFEQHTVDIIAVVVDFYRNSIDPLGVDELKVVKNAKNAAKHAQKIADLAEKKFQAIKEFANLVEEVARDAVLAGFEGVQVSIAVQAFKAAYILDANLGVDPRIRELAAKAAAAKAAFASKGGAEGIDALTQAAVAAQGVIDASNAAAKPNEKILAASIESSKIVAQCYTEQRYIDDAKIIVGDNSQRFSDLYAKVGAAYKKAYNDAISPAPAADGQKLLAYRNDPTNAHREIFIKEFFVQNAANGISDNTENRKALEFFLDNQQEHAAVLEKVVEDSHRGVSNFQAGVALKNVRDAIIKGRNDVDALEAILFDEMAAMVRDGNRIPAVAVRVASVKINAAAFAAVVGWAPGDVAESVDWAVNTPVPAPVATVAEVADHAAAQAIIATNNRIAAAGVVTFADLIAAATKAAIVAAKAAGGTTEEIVEAAATAARGAGAADEDAIVAAVNDAFGALTPATDEEKAALKPRVDQLLAKYRAEKKAQDGLEQAKVVKTASQAELDGHVGAAVRVATGFENDPLGIAKGTLLETTTISDANHAFIRVWEQVLFDSIDDAPSTRTGNALKYIKDAKAAGRDVTAAEIAAFIDSFAVDVASFKKNPPLGLVGSAPVLAPAPTASDQDAAVIKSLLDQNVLARDAKRPVLSNVQLYAVEIFRQAVNVPAAAVLDPMTNGIIGELNHFLGNPNNRNARNVVKVSLITTLDTEEGQLAAGLIAGAPAIVLTPAQKAEFEQAIEGLLDRQLAIRLEDNAKTAAVAKRKTAADIAKNVIRNLDGKNEVKKFTASAREEFLKGFKELAKQDHDEVLASANPLNKGTDENYAFLLAQLFSATQDNKNANLEAEVQLLFSLYLKDVPQADRAGKIRVFLVIVIAFIEKNAKEKGLDPAEEIKRICNIQDLHPDHNINRMIKDELVDYHNRTYPARPKLLAPIKAAPQSNFEYLREQFQDKEAGIKDIKWVRPPIEFNFTGVETDRYVEAKVIQYLNAKNKILQQTTMEVSDSDKNNFTISTKSFGSDEADRDGGKNVCKVNGYSNDKEFCLNGGPNIKCEYVDGKLVKARAAFAYHGTLAANSSVNRATFLLSEDSEFFVEAQYANSTNVDGSFNKHNKGELSLSLYKNHNGVPVKYKVLNVENGLWENVVGSPHIADSDPVMKQLAGCEFGVYAQEYKRKERGSDEYIPTNFGQELEVKGSVVTPNKNGKVPSKEDLSNRTNLYEVKVDPLSQKFYRRPSITVKFLPAASSNAIDFKARLYDMSVNFGNRKNVTTLDFTRYSMINALDHSVVGVLVSDIKQRGFNDVRTLIFSSSFKDNAALTAMQMAGIEIKVGTSANNSVYQKPEFSFNDQKRLIDLLNVMVENGTISLKDARMGLSKHLSESKLTPDQIVELHRHIVTSCNSRFSTEIDFTNPSTIATAAKENNPAVVLGIVLSAHFGTDFASLKKSIRNSFRKTDPVRGEMLKLITDYEKKQGVKNIAELRGPLLEKLGRADALNPVVLANAGDENQLPKGNFAIIKPSYVITQSLVAQSKTNTQLQGMRLEMNGRELEKPLIKELHKKDTDKQTYIHSENPSSVPKIQGVVALQRDGVTIRSKL